MKLQGRAHLRADDKTRIGEREQPLDLNLHAALNKAILGENVTQIVRFLGVSTVDGTHRGEFVEARGDVDR